MPMSPRERVEAVLRGEGADRVPFTVYESKLPQCEVERHLRNGGLCLVARTPPVHRTVSPNVTQERISYSEGGVNYIRTVIRTPVGDLSTIDRPAPGNATTWHVEKLFKTPDDYRAVEFMVRDQTHLPNYDAFLRAQKLLGDDGFLRATFFGGSPLQNIILNVMGVETFAVEWAERRDDVMRLYDAVLENRRQGYRVMAESPALATNYCGNVSPEVVGLERFEDYYVPHYNEFAEVMHKHNKLTGLHWDANVRLFAEAIGRSEVDYVEAFTPEPDGDMSVAEARAAWPDKVLWINFPSSVHLLGIEAVREAARQILREAAPGDRFLMGVTEDVHPDRWQESFVAIMDVIDREGVLPHFPGASQ